MLSPAPSSAVAELRRRLFEVTDGDGFQSLALDLFRLHFRHNPVYRAFIEASRIDARRIERAEAIPSLPITLFRSHRVLLEGLEPAVSFTSSGTTGSATSTHHVPWPEHYESSFLNSFSAVYGDPKEWRVLALLPSYLERTGSSLVYMAEKLIAESGDSQSGFYLNQLDELADVMKRSEAEGRKTLLLGVTFALLDLAERIPMTLRHTTIMETGGMKGRRPEIVRDELHSVLKRAFGVPSIHSEYGMTELLSQAWSTGDGIYRCPPWMQVRIREVSDPFAPVKDGRTGGIDVFDLANIASCPFISTQDLGRRQADGAFEVLGRFDNSDARGCNLLVEA